MSWRAVLTAWSALELDFQERYGIDLESGILRERSLRWFNLRAYALTREKSSRLHANLPVIP